MTRLLINAVMASQEKWAGIDETIVNKFAEDAGRPPAQGLLEGTGDLPLLMFLLAGLAGGFMLGYFYRELLVAHRSGKEMDRDVV